MSGFKGTPGPWDIEFNNKATKAKVSGEGWGAFARVWIKPSKVEGMANARLIAAAPELLDSAQLALSIAESWIHDQLDGTSHLESAMQSLDPVRAAIRKALGEE